MPIFIHHLIAAPIGAILIDRLAPKLLQKNNNRIKKLKHLYN